MVIVDAHCHAWPYWYEPIESALDSMIRNGVDKALLMPLAEGVDSHNTYQIECIRRFPGRFPVIATVDPHRPEAPEWLEEWAEHLGCRMEDTTPPYDLFRRVLALAEYPNMFMKVPGLGEICPRPTRFPRPADPLENIPPVIEMAMDAFGASRLMWGSDYPHVAEREGYGNCIRLLREQVVKTEEDREWIFGKTAATLFRFGE